MPNEPRRPSTRAADLALPNAAGLPKLSNVECMTITIVGVLPPITKANQDDWNESRRQFMAAIERALHESWPTFQPAHPPVIINVVSLPELRTPDEQ